MRISKFFSRIKEFLKVSVFRLIEFNLYTLSGIEFYRNYERFYWRNRIKKK